MINETAILLTPYEDCSKHRLAKHVGNYLRQIYSWELYFCEPLQRVFSRVIVYDYPKRQTEIGVKAVNEEIIELVRKEHPKYVVWVSGYYEFRESTFDILRKEGAIAVGLFFDDETRFDNYSKWWIPHLDYFVTNTIEAIPRYRALNARGILALPIIGGIPIDCDWSNIEEKYDVSFVGARDAYREQYINELKNTNIPAQVFGTGGEGGRYVPFEEVRDIFTTSKINLNFSMVRNISIAGNNDKMGVKGRIFEVCLAGGFVLTEYVPGIEDYFEIDKEIVCFQDKEEMVAKVIYYLNHDEERRAIAQAGWKRAASEHTTFHVFSRVFSEIEGDVAAKEKESIPIIPVIKMQGQIRKRFSDYYANWGLALSVENYKGLWKDALALSMSYYPFNIRAWGYYVIAFLPSFIRSALIKVHRALRSRFSFIP